MQRCATEQLFLTLWSMKHVDSLKPVREEVFIPWKLAKAIN